MDCKILQCMYFCVFLLMSTADQKTPLYFSYITTMSGDFVASGAIPMIDKALDTINARDDILQNYTLNYTTILDSQCSSSPSINAFFQHFMNTSQPTYVTSLCCGCSTATIPVAEISHHWNVPQVAYAAAASVLNDRERFKYFFRALPSFSFNSFTYAQLMREFGWTQIAIVTQQEPLFKTLENSLNSLFAEEEWTLHEIPVESNIEEFPYSFVFNEIDAGNHRIIVLNCYGEYAIAVLCEAYHRGMRYPDYVYLPLGGFREEWWISYPDTNMHCSHSEIAEMINGSISIVPNGYFVSQDTSMNTTSEQSIETFHNEYLDLLNQPQYSQYSEIGIIGVAYDAIWSIALGLDITSKKIASGNDSGCSHLPGKLLPLEMFDYSNEKLGCIMKRSLDEVAFTGVTKQFEYIDGSAVDTLLLLNQERMDENGRVKKILVATIDNQENVSIFEFLPGESTASLWGSSAPYDGTSVRTYVKGNLALQVIYYFLACCGLVFAGICAVFNFTFRNKTIVKLASPNLNYILLAGSVLLYSCALMYEYSVDGFNDATKFTVICNVRFWIFSLGYTTCFAVILSKQWRIYYILNNPTARKKTIKDRFLLIIIAILVAIDLIIVMINTAIPETRPKATLIPDIKKYSVSDTGIQQENFVFTCSNEKIYIPLLVSFIYKALLQVVGLFMAFHTRKIKIKALNDSKEIMAIIYINSIILASLAITEFGLRSYVNAYIALFGLSLLLEATLFIGVVFLPKMINLYLDPYGRKIFISSQQQQAENANQLKQGKNGSNESTEADGSNAEKLKANKETNQAAEADFQSNENSSKVSSLEEVVETGLP